MTSSDSIFKAIAHPARREILSLLSVSQSSVKELTKAFNMSQPAVSQHLRELRDARLVTSEKIGAEQRYRLLGEPLRMVFKWSSQYRRFFDPAGHAWAFASGVKAPSLPQEARRRSMAVKGSVPSPGVIVPHLVVRDAGDALAFYIEAFAAKVLYRSPSPSGAGEHIHLKVWASLIQLSTEEPAQQRNRIEGALLASPETLSAATCVFQVSVPSVDEAYRHAVDWGAVPAMPPTDMFWGDRYGWVRDPFGHVWALTEIREVLTPGEVEERLRGMTTHMKGQDA